MDEAWPVLDEPGFPLANLPFGVFARGGGPARVGVAVGRSVLDLGALDIPYPEDFATGSLNAFLARGPAGWAAVRERLVELLTGTRHRSRVQPHLIALSDVELRLPFQVADYVDFYASEHHAATVGRILRPGTEPLTPNWRHLPIGYHGRAGTVVVSGTPIVRPCGQRREPGEPTPSYGPTRRLDVEAEVGFVVGVGTDLGDRVSADDVAEHVFGVVLVNDWSARDIQAWEYVPLGPFLGKSFATSISPWVVPLAALEAARVPPPRQEPEPLPYLRTAAAWGLALQLSVECNGTVVARPPFDTMYWTPAQQLAHLTVNGARLRTGDLFASGTVSGPGADERGCLLELTHNGAHPVTLDDGSTRTYLLDGDTVVIRGTAPGPDGTTISLGAVAGTILPPI